MLHTSQLIVLADDLEGIFRLHYHDAFGPDVAGAFGSSHHKETAIEICLSYPLMQLILIGPSSAAQEKKKSEKAVKIGR